MTPYVRLQEDVIAFLRFRLVLVEGWEDSLRRLAKKMQTPGYCLDEETRSWLVWAGLCFPSPVQGWNIEADVVKIILEQVDDSGSQIVVRNILGLPLSGSGGNRLRTERFSQPGALKVGDVLATGETVCFDPREGGNGSVLVKLQDPGSDHVVWLSFPSRTALALLTPED